MAMDIIARGMASKANKELETKADIVNGKVPAEQLPSYVDDVIEYEDLSHFPEEGEEGKIYVALDTGFTYRWGGTEYVQIGGQDLSNFATKDEAFNTINASDIVDNTLTQAQYDLITNGKPTLIKGDWNGVSILFKPYLGGADFIKGWCIANDTLTSYQVFRTSKQIGLNGKSNYVAGVYSFNGKVIPAYPSNTGTFVPKCINGTLTWVEETQTPTGIYIEE